MAGVLNPSLAASPDLADDLPLDLLEQRNAPRLSDPPVLVDNFWSLVYDISLGGACLLVNREYREGEAITLVLSDARDGTKAVLRAEVMWCTGIWSNVRRAGVRWRDLSPEERVWLKERLKEWFGCCDTVLSSEDGRG